MSEQPEKPKIIVDSDWKSQAQAEKERLAAKEASSPPKSSSSRAPRGPDDLPPADFRTLVGSLATQALLYLGGFPDPETGRAMVALDLAQHYIDLLSVLEQKTQNNLTQEEAEELRDVAHDLRMRFVHVTEALARAEARGATKGPGPAGFTNPGPST